MTLAKDPAIRKGPLAEDVPTSATIPSNATSSAPSSLNDLSDVITSGWHYELDYNPVSGQHLTYHPGHGLSLDGTTYDSPHWMAEYPTLAKCSDTAGFGGATEIVSDRSALVLDPVDGASKWMPVKFELSELNDVSASTVSEGQVLSYDASESVWKNTSINSGASALSGLTDIAIDDTSLAGNQVLSYDAGESVWKNTSINSNSAWDAHHTIANRIDQTLGTNALTIARVTGEGENFTVGSVVNSSYEGYDKIALNAVSTFAAATVNGSTHMEINMTNTGTNDTSFLSHIAPLNRFFADDSGTYGPIGTSEVRFSPTHYSDGLPAHYAAHTRALGLDWHGNLAVVDGGNNAAPLVVSNLIVTGKILFPDGTELTTGTGGGGDSGGGWGYGNTVPAMDWVWPHTNDMVTVMNDYHPRIGLGLEIVGGWGSPMTYDYALWRAADNTADNGAYLNRDGYGVNGNDYIDFIFTFADENTWCSGYRQTGFATAQFPAEAQKDIEIYTGDDISGPWTLVATDTHEDYHNYHNPTFLDDGTTTTWTPTVPSKYLLVRTLTNFGDTLNGGKIMVRFLQLKLGV